MAKILCVTWGLPSVVYPSVELARRLAAAGHQLTFAGLAEFRDLALHHGLGFLPLDASRYPQFLEDDAKAGTFRRLLNLRQRRRRAAASMATSDFARAVADLAPDLLLIDGEMHEHIIAAMAPGVLAPDALAPGVPIVLLNSFASIWRRPGLPPAHCLVRPGVGWRGTGAGIWLLWLALRLRKWRRATINRLRRVGCDRVSILRQLASDAGFDFRLETDTSQWLIPFTYRRFPVLSLHAREFEFPHQPPARVHYVGPMLLESRPHRSMTEEGQTELEAIFARRRRSGGQRKLIYAGFGSVFSTDVTFLKRLLGIVVERPDWDLVISLSDRVALADLGGLPERVHAFPWLPQRQVLRNADAVVTHGGINTIDECVISCVPMLVYCGFETDMPGNTARVVHHGIGSAGDRRRDTTRDIRGHIDRLLSEPHFENNLKSLQSRYAAYLEDLVAEKVVQSLLDGPGARDVDR